MKYPELKGKCKTCFGCNRLENPYFTGVSECKYATQPRQEIKQKIRIGEQMRI